MSKLLLHTCCGPCSVAVRERLVGEGFDLCGYFCNPNIRPELEYQKRRLAMEYYATMVGLIVIFEKEPRGSLAGSFSPGDCENCYRERLTRTAAKAGELGFGSFSTTLLISPYQKHDLIRRIGHEVAVASGVHFHYEDFRPLFRAGQQKARELGLYRQKYCGCGADLIAGKEKVHAQTA